MKPAFPAKFPTRFAAAAALAAAAFAVIPAAHASGRVHLSIGIHGLPIYIEPAPIYVQPPQVHVYPRPVYGHPRPIYVQPQPVYVHPRGGFSRAPAYDAPALVHERRWAPAYRDDRDDHEHEWRRGDGQRGHWKRHHRHEDQHGRGGRRWD